MGCPGRMGLKHSTALPPSIGMPPSDGKSMGRCLPDAKLHKNAGVAWKSACVMSVNSALVSPDVWATTSNFSASSSKFLLSNSAFRNCFFSKVHVLRYILEQSIKIKDYLIKIYKPVKTNNTARRYSINFFIFWIYIHCYI